MPSAVGEFELHLYVDGHLDSAGVAAVEAYLAAHPDEAQRIASYRRQNELLRALGAALDAEPPPVGPSPPRRVLYRRPAAAAALLVAAGMGAAGVLLWRGPAPQLPVPPTPLGSFADAAAEAQGLVGDGTGAARLDAVLDRRLGGHLRVPDLSARGFALASGRLVPSATGPAVQLLYRDAAGRQVTLLLAAAEPPRAGDGQPLLFYAWSDGSVSIAIGGGIGGDELGAIADMVRRSLRPPAPQEAPRAAPAADGGGPAVPRR